MKIGQDKARTANNNPAAKRLRRILRIRHIQTFGDSPAFEIGFKVNDANLAFEELIGRGAQPVVWPTERPWGQRTAYLRDPDGHLIELAEDLDAA